MTCGVCCSHFRVSFYHGEVDDMPFGTVPGDMVEKLNETRACMKGTNQSNPRCVALSGTLGVSVTCTVYDKRPSPCREFNIWDENGEANPACQRLRIAFGLPVLTNKLITV